MENKKIVLIDGHSILNRAFYGVPILTNSKGFHTNAIYGFLNIMFKIMEEESPDYITVAFDLKAPTFRHELFDEYKGTRKPMPEELREQVPVMKDILRAMNISIVEKEGYEADDILGTIAKQAESNGMTVSLVSGDRDLLQLASSKIKIRIPKTKKGKTEVEDYNEEDVLQTYQISPLQIIELKALMGDTADNIPGIPGVGEKTATKIILEYGSIENAYEHVEEIKPPRAKESLKSHYDKARLSKVLATIKTDCKLEYQIEDSVLQDLYTEAAYEMFKDLEFKNLISRFNWDAPDNQIEEAFQKITDLTEAEKVFENAKNASVVGFYFVEDDSFVGLSIAYGEEEVFFIEAGGFITKAYLTDQLNKLLKSNENLSVLDLKSALKYLEVPDVKKIFDTSIAVYLLNPLKSEYTYDDIAKEFLNLNIPPKQDLIGKLKYEKALEEKPEEFLRFVSYMSYVPYKTRDILENKLKDEDMYQLFWDMETPLIYTLYDMETYGIKVEKAELKEYGDKLQVRILELEKEIYGKAGTEFNINSPKQLGEVLFEILKLPNGKKTKTGYSTAAGVLEKLASEHPIIPSILEYRQLSKLKSTYADGLANYIGKDQRIHSNFKQTIAATGRISSTEPNLQNIPIKMELGRLIRKVFVPEEGFVFVDGDYSQIELRVLAHISEDERLIQAYKEEADIHRMTASQVFHTPFDEVTPLQRSNAKAVNFGIVYGISAFGLSQDLNISRKEAGEYIEKYFETFPGVKSFLDNVVNIAKEQGYVKTMFERKRPIPELKSSNFMQRSFGERVAMNSPIQGTAADIIKIAMIRVNERLKSGNMKSRLILQIHDELLIEAHESEVSEVKEIMKEEMTGAAKLAVPLEVDIHTGYNWYEAK